MERTCNTSEYIVFAVGIGRGISRVISKRENHEYQRVSRTTDAATPAGYTILATGGDIFLNFGRTDVSPGPFSPMDGNDGFGSTEIQSLSVSLFVEAV